MKLLPAIVTGGLIAGALDIVYAFIVYGPLSYHMSPVEVLQSVAGGWIGRETAYAGGSAAAALGLGTHFLIAILMAAVFVGMTMRMPALTRHAVLAGFSYGLVLYVVMNYVVVPLSAAHASQHFAANLPEIGARLQTAFSELRPADRWQLAGTIFTHTILVGIPIALVNRKMYAQGFRTAI